jgi:hypothetical protein
MLLKLLLWHEHHKDAESLHNSNLHSEIFVLILFDKIRYNIRIEIVDCISVWSGFDKS